MTRPWSLALAVAVLVGIGGCAAKEVAPPPTPACWATFKADTALFRSVDGVWYRTIMTRQILVDCEAPNGKP